MIPFSIMSARMMTGPMSRQYLLGHSIIATAPSSHRSQPSPSHDGQLISIGSRSLPSDLHWVSLHALHRAPQRINAATLSFFFLRVVRNCYSALSVAALLLLESTKTLASPMHQKQTAPCFPSRQRTALQAHKSHHISVALFRSPVRCPCHPKAASAPSLKATSQKTLAAIPSAWFCRCRELLQISGQALKKLALGGRSKGY